jgi:hypothetical protein
MSNGGGGAGADKAGRLRAAAAAADCAAGGAAGAVAACPPAIPAAAHDPAHPAAPAPARLIVILRTPLGKPISGVGVDAAGHHINTGNDGRANFGVTPPGTYNVVARKPGFGPSPGAALWRESDGTGRAVVTAGNTTTLEIQLVQVESLVVSHTPVSAPTPLRIYKGAAGSTDVDHEITATVKIPKTAGAGAGTQFRARVDWTFTADGGNAPKARGGKDNTDVHFKGSTGFAAAGDMKITASTTTDTAGVTRVIFRASVVSGDHFTVHAKVLKDPANPAGGDWAHGSSSKFEVWKRLDYNNLYRMVIGANKGVDVTSLCVTPNIQPAYAPAFTEYHPGATHVVAYREFVSAMVAPTAAQLPSSSTVRVRSDGVDVRQVTVTGLVAAADGSARAGSETLTLAGATNVVGVSRFQRVDRASVAAADPARTIKIEEATGAFRAIGSIAAHARAVNFGPFLFDTAASAQTKAQAWADANQAQWPTDLAALDTTLGAAGFHLVGCAWLHPKHCGRHGGVTHFYTGYPAIHVTIRGSDFHPDQQWNNWDGMNSGQMSCLFLNVLDAAPLGGPYTKGVARHEIGHASDHTRFGPGDHCPQPASVCLMNANSTAGQFCTVGADHSLHRVMGWT